MKKRKTRRNSEHHGNSASAPVKRQKITQAAQRPVKHASGSKGERNNPFILDDDDVFMSSKAPVSQPATAISTSQILVESSESDFPDPLYLFAASQERRRKQDQNRSPTKKIPASKDAIGSSTGDEGVVEFNLSGSLKGKKKLQC